MTSLFTWHGAVNGITQHFFLKLVYCAIIWHKISHLKRRWKILRANQYYGILLFILTHVSFRKAVLLKTFPWILPHLNFMKKYNCIWCIKWCKYPCTLRTPHISSFTAAPVSTISPSSVAKLLLVSVNSHHINHQEDEKMNKLKAIFAQRPIWQKAKAYVSCCLFPILK